jgi:hypothetical protein
MAVVSMKVVMPAWPAMFVASIENGDDMAIFVAHSSQ